MSRHFTDRTPTNAPIASSRIFHRALIERLGEQGIAHEVLTLQNDATKVVVQRGGRLFLFLPDGEGNFWVHQAFDNTNTFAKLVGRGEWNIGGERVWISPEVQFNIRDRRDVWASYHLPKQMDPGQWTLERVAEDICRLRQELALETYNIASAQKRLVVERSICPVVDPPRNLTVYRALTRGVVFAGYEHGVTITEVERDGISCQAWDLIQLRPRGMVARRQSEGWSPGADRANDARAQ